MLHGLGKASCPKPCLGAARAKRPATCQDVVEGECYDAINWLKTSGIERHPHWYPVLGTRGEEEKEGEARPCLRDPVVRRGVTGGGGGVLHLFLLTLFLFPFIVLLHSLLFLLAVLLLLPFRFKSWLEPRGRETYHPVVCS